MTKTNDDYPPPTPEQWGRLPLNSKIYIFFLVWWSCCLPRLPLPLPVHFGVLSALCSFALMPLMPHRLIAFPIILGGGLAGALLLIGGNHARSFS